MEIENKLKYVLDMDNSDYSDIYCRTNDGMV